MKKKMRNLLLLGALSAALIGGGCSNATDSAAGASPAVDDDVFAAMRLIEQMPDSSAGHVRLASVYIRKARETGDFDLNKKADSAIASALEIEPGNLSALKLKASLLATFHRFDEARELGEKLKKDLPNDAFVYGILADANVETGNYEAAIEAAQKMADLKPNAASYARIAHLRSLHGDHKGAVEMLTLAARVSDPQDKEAQSWCLVELGKEYFKVGEIDLAERSIDESLEISQDYSLALIEKARILAARGDLESALGPLARVRFPSTEKLILEGDIYFKMGQTDQVQRTYLAAEELARGSDGDMHRFSLLWADHDTRSAEALQIAEEDYASNKDIYAADIYAWCLLKNDRAREAKEVITNALRLDSKDARILYHAGMIEKQLGNHKGGNRLLAEALRLNPSFDLIQAANARRAIKIVSN